MNSSLAKKILFDYFDGNYTSIQRKMIEEWLVDEANQRLFYQYLDEWESQNPQYTFNPDLGLKKILDTTQESSVIDAPVIEQSIQVNFGSLFKWIAAASVLLVFGWIGWIQYTTPKPISYRTLTESIKKTTGEIYEKVNVTSQPMLVNLPDKSSVVLQPNSKISYSPRQYNKQKREIILAGEAFFEVQKNANSPFFVYTNNLITKVLGTSFLVNAQKNTAEVIVKTGKVEIFLQNDINKSKKLTSKALSGLVLVANEAVKITAEGNQISRPIAVNQKQLNLPIQTLSFNFDETPATEVFEILRKAYNAPIVYDPAKLTSCKLTAHLSDEPLLVKIELICIALEASFNEVDNKIIIKSNGCN